MRRVLRWLRAQWLIGPVWRTCSGLRLLGRGSIHVRPGDNRGLVLRDRLGTTQPSVTWLWCRLRRALRPDTFVDLGANYGEIALACRYGDGETVLMVEANARIHDTLRGSVDSRPDAARFRLSDAFVGAAGEAVAFQIDEKWSGTSSSYIDPEDADYKGEGEQRVRVEHTTSRRLGDVVRDLGIADARLVLAKMDIEGGELAALRGAAEWLRSLRGWAIVCEVNEEFWGGGTSASAIAATLSEFGEVFYVPRGRRARALAGDRPPTERDVVIASPGPVADTVRRLRRPPWV